MRVLAITWALVLAMAVAAPAHAARDDERMAAFADAYAEHWLPRHPAAATALGDHRFDERLTAFSESSLRDDGGWTRDLEAAVKSLSPQHLSSPARIDRDVLLAQLDRDLLALEVLQPWMHDPSAFLPLFDDAIRVLVDRSHSNVCATTRALTRRLRQVPEVARSAMILLAHPDREALAAAIPGYEDVLQLYRGAVGEATAGCREGAQQADLAEADTLALRAVEDMLRAMREEMPALALDREPLPRATIERWLASEGVGGAPLESLTARAERERVPDPTPPLGPPDSTGATAARVSAADSLAALDAMETALDSQLATLAGSRGLSMPPVGALRLRVRSARPDERAAGFIAMPDSAPGMRQGDSWRIVCKIPALTHPRPEAVALAMPEPLIATAQAAALQEPPSRLRQMLRWQATSLGVRAGLVADIPLPGGDAPSTSELALDPRDQPGAALRILGRWQFEALRDTVRASFGNGFPPRVFHDAVIDAGPLPWPALRTIVFEQLDAMRRAQGRSGRHR